MNKQQALQLAHFEANVSGQIRYVFAEGNGFVVRAPHDVSAEELDVSILVMPEPYAHPTRVKV